ncbi:MAG: HlyD family efflux transporter periplasmic adaptor subunit [Clostridia bacterium]|nr:HlyD family efflux transporter periplasmic adaptor subunit [Clostridia bacterium]
MYRETPPMAPQPRKKLHAVQIVIIVVAVLFALWYLYKTLVPAATPYATIQAGTLGARYSGDVLIVRDETPYDAEGVSSIEYVAEEGKVARNRSTICNVFSTGYSTKETTALQNYRDQIKQYQLQLIGEETTYDARMERLDSDVL